MSMRFVPAGLIFFILVAIAARASSDQTQPEPITVIIVRHAEKQATGDDPALSEQGKARAAALKNVLEHAGVKRIIVSEYDRTRQTAEPLATKLGIELVAKREPGEIVQYIQNVSRGEVVLVVGHSNTVPSIVRALTGKEVPDVAENEYNNMYVVTLCGQNASLLRLQYGVN